MGAARGVSDEYRVSLLSSGPPGRFRKMGPTSDEFVQRQEPGGASVAASQDWIPPPPASGTTSVAQWQAVRSTSVRYRLVMKGGLRRRMRPITAPHLPSVAQEQAKTSLLEIALLNSAPAPLPLSFILRVILGSCAE